MIGRWISEADRFCQGDAVAEVMKYDPQVVGFTSSFQQNCASLSLMRQLKGAHPDIVTVLGGANCQTEMGAELFARFPTIDYIGQGECDHSVVQLLDAIAAGDGQRAVAGMLSRHGGESSVAARMITGDDLDRLPHPDFVDYFEQLSQCGLDSAVSPRLAMETSRGCWWGAKHHCTFCGLNGESMGFRSKSAERALEEIGGLVERYRIPQIAVADNILDMNYFKTVLPRLADQPHARLFYETKSNLTRAQVDMLARGGVASIQPGIESFSDQTLRIMRKGCTKLQNVQLLKWCGEAGIHVVWNFLFGFPGEDEDEVPDIVRDMQAIHHLQPPSGATVVRIDRFSPYFNDPEGFKLGEIRPFSVYQHIYPFAPESLRRIAYFFESDFMAAKAESPAFQALEAGASAWGRAYRRSHLVMVPRRHSLIILDTRRGTRRFWHRLTGLRRAVYEHCDSAHGVQEVVRSFTGRATETEIAAALESLIDARLMLRSGGRYLSLATEPGSEPVPLAGRAVTHNRARWRRLGAAAAAVVTGQIPVGQAFDAIRKRVRWHKERKTAKLIRKTVFTLARVLRHEPVTARGAAQQSPSAS